MNIKLIIGIGILVIIVGYSAQFFFGHDNKIEQMAEKIVQFFCDKGFLGQDNKVCKILYDTFKDQNSNIDFSTEN